MKIMDTDFWDALIDRLSYAELTELAGKIERKKRSMHPEIVARKAIIRRDPNANRRR